MSADETARDVARRIVAEALATRSEEEGQAVSRGSRPQGAGPTTGAAPPRASESPSEATGPAQAPHRVVHAPVAEARREPSVSESESPTQRAARRRDAGVLARPQFDAPPVVEPAEDPKTDPRVTVEAKRGSIHTSDSGSDVTPRSTFPDRGDGAQGAPAAARAGEFAENPAPEVDPSSFLSAKPPEASDSPPNGSDSGTSRRPPAEVARTDGVASSAVEVVRTDGVATSAVEVARKIVSETLAAAGVPWPLPSRSSSYRSATPPPGDAARRDSPDSVVRAPQTTAGPQARAAARRIVAEALADEAARMEAASSAPEVDVSSVADTPHSGQSEDEGTSALKPMVEVSASEEVPRPTVDRPQPTAEVSSPTAEPPVPTARVDLLPAVPPAGPPAASPVGPSAQASPEPESVQESVDPTSMTQPSPGMETATSSTAGPAGAVPAAGLGSPPSLLDRWKARRHRKRLAAQWAPGATPAPRRTWRWVLATMVAAIAIAVLFPLTIAAIRSLVAL